MNEDVNTDRLNSLVDEARERLAEIGFASTIQGCFNWLQRDPNEGFDWYQRLPFIILLMIKWAFELWVPKSDRRAATPDDFEFIAGKIFDATGQLHEPRPTILIRRAAFQQFWYQREFELGSIPRQALIFGALMEGTEADRLFVNNFGIRPVDFLRQIASLVAQVGELLQKRQLAQLRPAPSNKDEQHWTIMSRFFIFGAAQVRERILQLAAYGTPREVELCEQTPLVKFPFLITPPGPQCIHHKVLYQSIATSLYDILREMRGAGPFMNEFGPAFENYISEVVNELPYRNMREKNLKCRLTGKGKCVDFVIHSDDCLLLVDAKGIEGHYDGLYHNLTEVLTEKLRTTAIHAVDQAVSTVSRLPENLRRPMTVFICVTYKQLNIGDGDALRDLTAGTEDFDHSRWKNTDLSPKQMFTISVNEFELLCGVLRRGVPLRVLFEKVVNDNEGNTTQKFLFEQHMAHYGEVDIPTCSLVAARAFCGIG